MRRHRDRRGQPGHRDRGGAVALEGPPPGQHLEHHDAERVDVRPLGRRLATGLLGAHVLDRPQGRPGQRHLGLGDRPGDPEVGHLDPAVLGEEDVPGLDVAMDDPPGVGGGQRAGDLGRDPGHLGRRERTGPPEERREVLPVDVVHDDERPGGIGPEVVDGDDVRAS